MSGVEVAESVGEDGGFGVWVDLDYEGFGLGSGCGWGCEGSRFVGVCSWGGGGGGASDLVLVGYGFVLNCVLGSGGCGGCVVVAVGCWQQCGGC